MTNDRISPDQAKRVFGLFDKYDEGAIQKEDLGTVLRTLGLCPSNEQVDDLAAQGRT
jgi:Ca2+-binding EF-hand superfamily protein